MDNVSLDIFLPCRIPIYSMYNDIVYILCLLASLFDPYIVSNFDLAQGAGVEPTSHKLTACCITIMLTLNSGS